jgi:hypothetical protein
MPTSFLFLNFSGGQRKVFPGETSDIVFWSGVCGISRGGPLRPYLEHDV